MKGGVVLFPDEKPAITRKIWDMTKDGVLPTVHELIDAYWGEHDSHDWRECLEEESHVSGRQG